ncbi:hypothetical protein CL176_01290 [Suicoccus acidiformans]|uniref:Uncharacterized protein n=1 Tax=Suicoccus acidiformans TaxID=2036206 RepID=A0A347WI51_9LACT|nr:Spo0B domain-containing protein [Suicoccus acidiformans]AXY24758.1 hypothetical protein CL176_01290 [Suicoccus acidiformans]
MQAIRHTFKNQKLLLRLLLLILATILITITVFYGLLIAEIRETSQREQMTRILQIATQVARNPTIVEETAYGVPSDTMQAYASEIEETFELDYVVVLTPESIRLTHPNPERRGGQYFGDGGQELRAFEGESYTLIGRGTLGEQLRAFVPIYHSETGEVIGAVNLGITLQTLDTLSQATLEPLTWVLLISLGLGFLLAFLLAYSLKKQMHDMEPQEIAQVLEERNAMLTRTLDGVIVTNPNQEIILINDAAQREFAGQEGDELADILPFLDGGEGRSQKLYQVSNKSYIVSLAPIMTRHGYSGQIYIIRNATELYMLINQLSTTDVYVQTLATQSHDFLNKLHVIYGLADLKQYDALSDYLAQLIEPQARFEQSLSLLVHNPTIAGFLIKQRLAFEEMQTAFHLEITNEIPATANYFRSQQWLEQTEELLEVCKTHLADFEDLHVQLAYEEHQLRTCLYLTNVQPDLVKLLDEIAYTEIQSQANQALLVCYTQAY